MTAEVTPSTHYSQLEAAMNITATSTEGFTNINTSVTDIETCPLCHHAIDPAVYGAPIWNTTSSWRATTERTTIEVAIQIALRCPRKQCLRLFIARYIGQLVGQAPHFQGTWNSIELAPRVTHPKAFPSEVVNVSSRFVEIYRQASEAEGIGLDQICGPGYRKALEFLIKDFLKSQTADDDDREAIEKQQLGNCIAKVTDPKLKSAASRATWLGNDETHYVRKWENKDLGDLKKLIDLTVHWVSAEVLTRDLESSMPAPKRESAANL
jgi:hypothetical protein